jgi:hypothetical protein
MMKGHSPALGCLIGPEKEITDMPLTWIPASVGCYWDAGEYHISTYTTGASQIPPFPDSGYRLTRNREEIGCYKGLATAKRAADEDLRLRYNLPMAETIDCEACGKPTTNEPAECCGSVNCDECGCFCNSLRIPLSDIDWPKIGAALRESAIDAHEGTTDGLDAFGAPHVGEAYSFLLDNPECFLPRDGATETEPDWPLDMPKYPPAALVAAYYRITVQHAELWLNARAEHSL